MQLQKSSTPHNVKVSFKFNRELSPVVCASRTNLTHTRRNNLPQVNLEYLARVVFDSDGVLYPDSLVGTDSHTPMINGLGMCA